jgi:hypothetical protein
MDHTLVDIMVVDEVHRQSMGRPWVTIAFDLATRVVLGFVLNLNPPSPSDWPLPSSAIDGSAIRPAMLGCCASHSYTQCAPGSACLAF